jgi:hypothetical protein
MATNERDDDNADETSGKPSKPASFDPRDTEHPTGAKQAAENAANDPPA